MDKPSIDELLKHAGGIYDLATIAARRAVEIKKKDKGTTQALQRALDEISRGEVNFAWKNRLDSGEQIELPLEEVGVVTVAEEIESFDEEVIEEEVDSATEEAEDEKEDDTDAEEDAEETESTEEEEEEYSSVDEDVYDAEEYEE